MGEKKHPIILDEFRNEPITEDAKKGRGNNGNDGGGGNDMSKYITREEFNAAIKDLTHQIEIKQEKTNHSFDLLSQKLDNIATSIPDKIQISLDVKEKEDRKETIETRRYIIGTILLGVVGIVISLLL